MKKRGYITCLTKDEEFQYVKRIATALHKKEKILHTNFTILVTYDCNFRCPYCFEEEARKCLDKKQTFSKEMVDKVYNAILTIEPRKELRNNVIALYGGEPLLKENYEIVRYIVKKGKELGFIFTAVTNGYDLDSFEDLLSPDLIAHLQITIDGVKDFHNQRRVHYKGYPTFDKIVSNIGLALQKNVSVVVRVNTDKKNIADLQPLKHLFDKLHYTDKSNFKIDSALLRNYSMKKDLLDCFSQYDFLKAHEELNYAYSCQNYGVYQNIYSAITQHKPLAFKANFCHSQVNGYVLDPFGKIYPCWDIVGKSLYQIGSYEDGSLNWNSSILSKWREHYVMDLESCKHCKYALFCGGGCFAHSLEKHVCLNMKSIFIYVVNKTFCKMLDKSLINN